VCPFLIAEILPKSGISIVQVREPESPRRKNCSILALDMGRVLNRTAPYSNYYKVLNFREVDHCGIVNVARN
jgi:hypothetical protein